MHALSFLLALPVAALLAPVVLRGLGEGGHAKVNYRDRALPCPFGVLILAAALLALAPLALIERLADVAVLGPGLLGITTYTLGIACLGLIDDTLGAAGSEGSSPPRGWRGHGRALLRGHPSTGALKAVGSLGLALFALSGAQLSTGRWLLAAAVLVAATHLFNLLDLRPGRTLKAFVALGTGLTIGAASPRALWAIGLFAGPALVAGVYDLRERALLGDTGASLIGALAGLWLVATLSGTGQAIALAFLLLVTVYGELRSISALIERTPGLRGLDSLGRPT